MSIVIKVALCARAALAKGVSRVLIVDWDVHHGQVPKIMRKVQMKMFTMNRCRSSFILDQDL